MTTFCRLLLVLLSTVPIFGWDSPIGSVAVNRSTFNPTLGDDVTLHVTFARAGRATVQVVDRDGYLVRLLVADTAVSAGVSKWSWDGRTMEGGVVPNEAYSFRIAWTDGNESAVYFPADGPVSMTSITPDYYAARSATVSYTLPVASRVHMQAGLARKNEKSGEMIGPVMKTIVNREPRAAGKVADPWNGLDESGLLRIAEMRNFVLAIAATPLPENSVITYGNAGAAFVETASHRDGVSLFTKRPADSHAHHAGLSVLDDVSPALAIEPLNATWSDVDRAWRVAGRKLRIRVRLEGPSAQSFSRHPAELYQFVDAVLLKRSRPPRTLSGEIEISLSEGTAVRDVSLNWRSEYGAVAANTIRVRTDAAASPSRQRPRR